jgi:arylsulfatase A-like enzyme
LIIRQKDSSKWIIKLLLTIIIAVVLGFYSCVGYNYRERLSKKKKPNFLFIVIDDLGWKDLTCYGSTFYETPNIDKLALEGMLFTAAYAASPVCSPTRAALLSGKNPARLHLTNWIRIRDEQKGKLLPADFIDQLPLEEFTIAEALKVEGYTNCFIGKWHLTNENDSLELYYPRGQGFDINIGGCYFGSPWHGYFDPYKIPHLSSRKEGEYLPDRLTDEALGFIEKNRDKPFLLYLSYYAVHKPIQAKEEMIEKYREKASLLPARDIEFISERTAYTKLIQDDPAYAAMVKSVDDNIGHLIKKLDELGITENTIVIFTSDNGGLSTLRGRKDSPTAILPLRAGKGWLYEGGIRIPLIIKWPGEIIQGSVCDVPVISMDLYPTLLEMAGLELNPEQHKDGFSLIPLLKDEGKLKRSSIFWHYPHYHGSGSRPSGAVRAGDYKLIQWYEDGSIELYNLKEDIGEKINLADKEKGKANKLKKIFHDWLKEIDAWMPKPNPDYTIPEE